MRLTTSLSVSFPLEPCPPRMGHLQIEGDGGSLRALAGLSARRIFVHINNTNPILIEGSVERRTVEDAGWQVAEDGMEIVL